MQLTNLLAITLAAGALAHVIPNEPRAGANANPDSNIPDTADLAAIRAYYAANRTLEARDDDPWPEAHTLECLATNPKDCVDVLVIKKGDRSGDCINSRPKENQAIILDDGIMCEYWKEKDCKASRPNTATEKNHLGPYGGLDVQSGTGMYQDRSYRAGTFPMWDPRSYQCRRITFGDTPARVIYCYMGVCNEAANLDNFG